MTDNYELFTLPETDYDRYLSGFGEQPMSITCGTPGRSITFTADPNNGTVSIRSDNTNLNEELEIDGEEFGLIAALMLRIADPE